MRKVQVLIQDVTEKGTDWSGTIKYPSKSGQMFSFEAIRPIDISEMYSTSPFPWGEMGVEEKVKCVTALLDFQRPCTFVRPLIFSVNPGSMGTSLRGMRTKIKGSFQALLEGMSVADPDEPLFKEVWFSSEALSVWARPAIVEEQQIDAGQRYSLEFNAPTPRRYKIVGVGCIELNTDFSRSWTWRNKEIFHNPVLSLKFNKKRSLSDCIKICGELEVLLGFLTGFRTRFPEFNLVAGSSRGRNASADTARLVLSGVHFSKRKGKVERSNCLHFEGRDGANLGRIVRKFFERPEDIVDRMGAVQYATNLSRNMNDKFSRVIPILEKFLKERFPGDKQEGIENHKDEFFEFLEKEAPPHLMEFSKRFLIFRPNKPEGFKRNIESAISYLNERGWDIPMKMAQNIQKRRGGAFHGSWKMEGEDILRFHWEITIATVILMFLTLEELGINIKKATKYYRVRWDYGLLLKKTKNVL